MATAIEINALRKEYRNRRGTIAAVAGLDLEVPEGGVFGFLGANGAGKTTTIRAVIGHLLPTSGTIRVLGTTAPGRLHEVIDRVGALVEAPSFFPNFSGRRNLELLARSRGIPRSRVDEALDAVGLTARAGSRVGTYSLGMRQRLGVAAVLLKDADVLILDEPANGLDPAGILEMRTLMRRLGAEGRTVFVSSHILSEIQQTADRVAIIAAGRCVAQGTVAELLHRGSPSRYQVRVPGTPDDAQRAAAVLSTDGFRVSYDGQHLLVDSAPEYAARITYALSQESIYLTELTPIERSLEDVFLELTTGAGSGPPHPSPGPGPGGPVDLSAPEPGEPSA